MAKNIKLNDTIKILRDLVGLKVLGGDSNLQIVDYIVAILIEKNLEYHLIPNDALTKSSIICRIGPSVDGGIILSGHTDVVPVEGQEWSTSPFRLTKKDDKLYARGSADMKGFIACCIASIDTFSKSNLKKPIYFAFSFDEEIGCLSGDLTAEAFKKKYTEAPEYAIIGEPSLMQPVNGQKGICVLETVVNGSAGHSSRIMGEVSAVHICASLIMWLEKYMESFVDSDMLDDRFTPPAFFYSCRYDSGRDCSQCNS